MNDGYEGDPQQNSIDALIAERDAAQAEVARLREALKPFSARAWRFDGIEPGTVLLLSVLEDRSAPAAKLKVGDLRRAAAALQETAGSEQSDG